MKAIGLDTCVVLRLLVGEPEAQAQCALAHLEKCHYGGVDVCVSDMVICEAYHALIYHYRVPKRQAVMRLYDFLASPMITALGHALSVLGEYRGSGPGLADRLIRMDFLDEVHEVVTLDQDFSRLPNVRLLR